MRFLPRRMRPYIPRQIAAPPPIRGKRPSQNNALITLYRLVCQSGGVSSTQLPPHETILPYLAPIGTVLDS